MTGKKVARALTWLGIAGLVLGGIWSLASYDHVHPLVLDPLVGGIGWCVGWISIAWILEAVLPEKKAPPQEDFRRRVVR